MLVCIHSQITTYQVPVVPITTEIYKNRICLTGFDPELSNKGIFRAAFNEGLFPKVGHKRFIGKSETFAYIDSSFVLMHCRMRENWNGWHDVAAYSTPQFLDVGKLEYADASRGQHRNVIRV